MLTDIYIDMTAIERLRTAPGGCYLDDFTQWLLGARYSQHTIRAYVPAVVDFMTWKKGRELPEAVLDQSVLDGYREHLALVGRWKQRYGAASNYYTGARRFLVFLREAGIAREPTMEIPDPVAGFRAWLLDHRGLRPLSVDSYVREVLAFIDDLGCEPEHYEAASIRAFVLKQAHGYSTSKAKNVVTALRNYLRFLIAFERCRPNLDEAVPRIAGWRLSTLPKYMNAGDVERVVAACDSSVAAGARDQAVILLLARLALRAGDVAGLKLGDIHWEEARLRVVGKTRRESWLPLPQQVGDAILHYIDTGRTAVNVDAVFINNTAPYRPITSHTVSQIARRAITRAGVVAPSHGAHVFRHSAATALLSRGVRLQDIGTILRHDSVESVAYYAKVDLDLLRSIARPWPGRRSC